jgi:endoglucanase
MWNQKQARLGRVVVLFYLIVGLSLACPTWCPAQLRFTGVNLFGAEFGVRNGDVNLPGNYNQHYTYPTAAEVNYFVGKGMNTFRLPFRWERLQRSLFADLHGLGPGPTGELDRMDTFVNAATSAGAYVILEPHNFQRYFPDTNNFQSSSQGLVGSSVPDTAYADFWGKVADHYQGNERVIFNLMNEPNSMPTSQLVTSQNAAIETIRDAGARNLILVPGNQWTGAWAWNETWYQGANAVHMLNIVDPIDNFAFDVHQYFDHEKSGETTQIGDDNNINNVNIGVERLTNFTNWMHANNRKGFLGEFAVAESRIGNGTNGDGPQIGDETIQNTLDYIQANDDVWLGWAWWAAGPWFTEYMFSIEPGNLGQPNQTDSPVMPVLQPYFAQLLPGDFNFDGLVDAADYTVWRDSLGLTGTANAADANFDGLVDDEDYDTWLANFGNLLPEAGAGALAGGAVPEPGAMTLLVVGCVSLGVRARRRRPA